MRNPVYIYNANERLKLNSNKTPEPWLSRSSNGSNNMASALGLSLE